MLRSLCYKINSTYAILSCLGAQGIASYVVLSTARLLLVHSFSQFRATSRKSWETVGDASGFHVTPRYYFSWDLAPCQRRRYQHGLLYLRTCCHAGTERNSEPNAHERGACERSPPNDCRSKAVGTQPPLAPYSGETQIPASIRGFIELVLIFVSRGGNWKTKFHKVGLPFEPR